MFRSANPSLAILRVAAALVALANEVIGDQDFAAPAHGWNWHFSDMARARRDFRYGRKSRREADLTGTAESHPNPTSPSCHS